MRAKAQTFHFKYFWTHQRVILDLRIAKNKVGQVLPDTLYILKWPWTASGFLLGNSRWGGGGECSPPDGWKSAGGILASGGK